MVGVIYETEIVTLLYLIVINSVDIINSWLAEYVFCWLIQLILLKETKSETMNIFRFF